MKSNQNGPRSTCATAKSIVGACLVLAFASVTQGHNNAVVHPLFTHRAIEEIKAKDWEVNGGTGSACEDCAYTELWQPPFQGEVRNQSFTREAADNEDPYLRPFSSEGVRDIVMGSVVEDRPGGLGLSGLPTLAVVVNHFYHAQSGAGLLGIWESSRARAEEIFLHALRVYDYTEESKEEAYLFLGRFLHHVQDMTSPAHVHNDAHVGFGDFFGDFQGHDDYEARYVPYFLWAAQDVCPELPRLTDLVTPAEVVRVDGLDEVWSSDGLAGRVWRGSSFSATIDYDVSGHCTGTNEPCVTGFDCSEPPRVCQGQQPRPVLGELKAMFPREGVPPDRDEIFWDDGGLFSPGPSWVIDRVGAYHYLAGWGTQDEWWPDVVGDEDAGSNRPAYGDTRYYLENLMTGEECDSAIATAVRRNAAGEIVPNRWCGGDEQGQPCQSTGDCSPGTVCSGGTSLLRIQAETWLKPAVGYSAGAAQWWFRLANHPPFLRTVVVTQEDEERVKYHATWIDKLWERDLGEDIPPLVLREVGPIPDTEVDLDLLARRDLGSGVGSELFDPNLREHVRLGEEMKMDLQFSEPIKEISRLKLLTAQGEELIDLLKAPGISTPLKGSEIDDCVANEPVCSFDRDTRWVIRIDGSWLLEQSKLHRTKLNGEITLQVNAIDKNEHEGGGANLDTFPFTPARREIPEGASVGQGIRWRTSGPEAYEDNPEGDRNHKLLFDAVPPAVEQMRPRSR